VTTINSVPLLDSSWNGSLATQPGDGQIKGSLRTTYYFGDEQMLPTLGLKLIAGRAFNAGDVHHEGFRGKNAPDVVIVTKAIADKLFPKGAVGKQIYIDGNSKPTTIVGVVARMQVPATGSWANSFTWYSTLVPTRLNGNYSRYAVRAKPGRLAAAMREVTPALYKTDPMRVLDDDSVRSFADIRAHAYRADIGMAVLMGTICLMLIAVTAAGIVGLTSFWVGQRHRQIGVRRALGARKIDILHYFQTENLMIAGGGAVLGVALAIGLNLLLMHYFEMDRLPLTYVLIGIVTVLILGQAAVFAPARRASNVSPVEATRSG
jgi:putative ABC transport system permease protein